MLDSISLIFPRLKYRSGDPPLGLCYIAGYLRKIYPALEIQILDSTFQNSFLGIKKKLRKKKPQAVGIYIDTIMYTYVRELIKELSSQVPFFIAGGPHATVSPESLLDLVDIVVTGEGEKTVAELVSRLPEGNLNDVSGIYFKKNGHIHYNRKMSERIPLDDLEIPALDLLGNIENYINHWHYLDPLTPKLKGLNLIASRGCPFNCSYCQPTLKEIFGKRIRYKSPEYLVNELKYYIQTFKVTNFFFHDDTLTLDRNWIKKFCQKILEENLNIQWGCNSRIDTVDEETLELMSQAGLRVIHYGIESGSQRIIDEVYDKKIDLKKVDKTISLTRKKGIFPAGFFMLGAPGERVIEMMKTIRLSLKLELAEASFSITTPFIGTRLRQMMKDNPHFKISQDPSRFDYYSKISYLDLNRATLALTTFLFQKLAVVIFYLHFRRWMYIGKHLLSLTGIKKLVNKIARFF